MNIFAFKQHKDLFFLTLFFYVFKKSQSHLFN